MFFNGLEIFEIFPAIKMLGFDIKNNVLAKMSLLSILRKKVYHEYKGKGQYQRELLQLKVLLKIAVIPSDINAFLERRKCLKYRCQYRKKPKNNFSIYPINQWMIFSFYKHKRAKTIYFLVLRFSLILLENNTHHTNPFLPKI